MRRFIFFPVALMFIAMLFLPVSSQAYIAYVQSIHADVHQSPTMKSPKTMSLVKGDSVEVVKENGSFYQISFEGSTGYIYRFLVSTQKIGSSEKLYSKLQSFFHKIESVSGKSRRRPSSYTATAAARGLRDKRRNFAESYTSDYESLARFEALVIGEDEALAFLRKGVTNEKDR